MTHIIAALVGKCHLRFGTVLRDKAGVSAVEFALIVPVMMLVLLGIIEFGSILFDRTDMHTAVRSGVQYVMNGGRNTDDASNIVLMSWSTKPETGTVNVTRYCLCTEAEHACSLPCSDMSVPEAYIWIEASATLGGLVYSYGHKADEVVRIR